MTSATRLRAVVVLYHPDDGALAMVDAIAADGCAPVVVINAIGPAQLARLRANGVDLLVNAENIGLAAAFNQGIGHAVASGAEHVMLLDQDSRPPPGMAARLVTLADSYRAAGGRFGCIGPVPVDRKRPQAQTMASAIDAAQGGVAEVATIISSGMTLSREAVAAVGGMWDALFIDQIDHEWCFRARAGGFAVLAAVDVTMPHDMGDAGFTFFGRYKPIHRSPVRHFHIVRNTLWLARCSFIPPRWRLVETLKLGVRIPAYLLFSSARAATLAAVWRGVVSGLRGPPARISSASLAKPIARFIS